MTSSGPARPENDGTAASRRSARATTPGSLHTGALNRSSTLVGLPLAAGKCAASSALPAAESEPAGTGGVVDEVAHQSLDPRAFEHENHGFIGEKDAVSPKASPVESVRRSLCEDRPCLLAQAWLEPGNDRDALIGCTSTRRLYTLGLVEGIRHRIAPEFLGT